MEGYLIHVSDVSIKFKFISFSYIALILLSYVSSPKSPRLVKQGIVKLQRREKFKSGKVTGNQ